MAVIKCVDHRAGCQVGLAYFCFARLRARARMQQWRARVKLSKKYWRARVNLSKRSGGANCLALVDSAPDTARGW